MKRYLAVIGVCWFCLSGASLFAQKVDVTFGGGSLFTSATEFNGAFLPSEGGSTYLGTSADVLLRHNLGVQGEVYWRVNQGLYGGQIPFRPVFWNFNAMYFHRSNKLLAFEAVAGVGVETLRFYSGNLSCDVSGNCTNFISNNHFMGAAGGGLRLYFYHRLFIRPEARVYMIPNNTGNSKTLGFSSDFPLRYGASIGYAFGASKY